VAGGAGNRTHRSPSIGGPMSVAARGCRVSTDGITFSPTFRGLPAVFRIAFAFFALLTVNSCHNPLRPDGEIRSVTARDLVRQYRDDPGAASLAFSEQAVRVYVTAADVSGNAVHWHAVFTDPRSPPALVFRFEGRPTFTAPGWIEGHCLGRTPDRGVPGYGFRVVVSGCVVR
jgi:hypothetical protein